MKFLCTVFLILSSIYWGCNSYAIKPKQEQKPISHSNFIKQTNNQQSNNQTKKEANKAEQQEQTEEKKGMTSLEIILTICLLTIIAAGSTYFVRKHILAKKRNYPQPSSTSKEDSYTQESNADLQPKHQDRENTTYPPVNTSQPLNLTKEPNVSVKDINGFACFTPQWSIVGASVIGASHISTNQPCQDNNGYEDLGNGWGIAVVSDGAGSAEKSHIGSKITTDRALAHFGSMIKEKKWIENNYLPTDEEWNEIAYFTLKAVYNDLQKFAANSNIDVKSLNATAIVVIHTPSGLLACHVGDGRAGYKNTSGTWLPLITPHKGEEANQTIFIPTDFWSIPYYRMSGVRVPEAIVVREPVQAFTLMSDGCEGACWEYNFKNPTTGFFYDPNKPHTPFFDPALGTLSKMRQTGYSSDQLLSAWYSHVKNGNHKFETEPDDRTLILALSEKQNN